MTLTLIMIIIMTLIMIMIMLDTSLPPVLHMTWLGSMLPPRQGSIFCRKLGNIRILKCKNFFSAAKLFFCGRVLSPGPRFAPNILSYISLNPEHELWLWLDTGADTVTILFPV